MIILHQYNKPLTMESIFKAPKNYAPGFGINSALKLNKICPQVNKNGKLNYAYLGGTAVSIYMELNGAKRKITDFDIFLFNKDPYLLQTIRSIKYLSVDIFPGIGPFGVTLKEKDINILRYNGKLIALFRPEMLLSLKLDFKPREHDINDSLWILNNIKLNKYYYESTLFSHHKEALSLDKLYSVNNNHEDFVKYMEHVYLKYN